MPTSSYLPYPAIAIFSPHSPCSNLSSTAIPILLSSPNYLIASCYPIFLFSSNLLALFSSSTISSCLSPCSNISTSPTLLCLSLMHLSFTSLHLTKTSSNSSLPFHSYISTPLSSSYPIFSLTLLLSLLPIIYPLVPFFVPSITSVPTSFLATIPYSSTTICSLLSSKPPILHPSAKYTYLSPHFYRPRSPRIYKLAAVSVSHSISIFSITSYPSPELSSPNSVSTTSANSILSSNSA